VAALGVALLATLTLPAARADDEKDATPSTQAANRAVLDTLPFANRQDYEDAQRGFVAALPNDSTVQGSRDVPVWSLKGYEFLAAPTAPDTVNPSLWRQAQLNEFAGLFRVTDRVYQVRGLDISNMTLIEGDTGLIIIDPLISAETARAALDLYRSARPARSASTRRTARTPCR